MGQAIYAPRCIFVDPVAGLDTAGGTQNSPVATVAQAVTRLVCGGTIMIKGTPYNGSVTVDSTKPITLQPWGSTTCYIVGSAATSYGLRTIGTGLTTLRNLYVVGQESDGIRCGLTGGGAGVGRLAAYDTYAEGPDNGFATSGQWESLDCWRCTGKATVNDGFNIHGVGGAQTATLTDCIGNDCGDEGASPHDNTILHLIGGEYRRNGQSGMAAVNNAVCTIQGGDYSNNGRTAPSFGGVYWTNNASGSLDGGVRLTGNAGRGVWLDATTGTVALGSYSSSGNGAADSLL